MGRAPTWRRCRRTASDYRGGDALAPRGDGLSAAVSNVRVMTRPDLLPDTWFSRDLPVLIEAVRHFDGTHQPLQAAAVAERLGWPVETVTAAVRALARGDYVQEMELALGTAGGDYIAGVSAQAYRAAGAWPNVDTMADRLHAALQAAVDNAPDAEARSRARRALEAVCSAGRDFMVDVASGVVTGQITA